MAHRLFLIYIPQGVAAGLGYIALSGRSSFISPFLPNPPFHTAQLPLWQRAVCFYQYLFF